MLPTLSAADLRLRCERRVRQTVTPEQLTMHGLSRTVLIQRLAPIVARNFQSGRAQRIIGTARPIASDQIEGYIERTIATFLLEHSRLDRLAVADADSWARLLAQLTQRAQVLLSRITTSPATAPEAMEFAQAACEIIFHSPFPYDVSFDAWATLILKNTIWLRYQRSRDVLDRISTVESLDCQLHSDTGEACSLHELLTDSTADVFEQSEIREWLLNAVEQLPSAAQKHVLIDVYFNERAMADVAHRLGRSAQAVYNLKHRALSKLRQILIRERSSNQSPLILVKSHAQD